MRSAPGMKSHLYREVPLIRDGDEVHDGGGAQPDVHTEPDAAPRVSEYPVLVSCDYVSIAHRYLKLHN